VSRSATSGRLARAEWGALCTLLALLWATSARAGDNFDVQQFLEQNAGENTEHEGGYHAPNGRWRMPIPSSFAISDDETTPDFVVFNGASRGFGVKLIVQRVKVVPGASSSQLMLSTRDGPLAKLPHFAVLQTKKVSAAGRPCVNLVGRYDYEGNKNFPQIVDQTYIVDGGDGFILHFEVNEAGYDSLVQRIADLQKHFTPITPPPPKPLKAGDKGAR
jgi:hypothetical protein